MEALLNAQLRTGALVLTTLSIGVFVVVTGGLREKIIYRISAGTVL
jgi:hypothetical protein